MARINVGGYANMDLSNLTFLYIKALCFCTFEFCCCGLGLVRFVHINNLHEVLVGLRSSFGLKFKVLSPQHGWKMFRRVVKTPSSVV